MNSVNTSADNKNTKSKALKPEQVVENVPLVLEGIALYSKYEVYFIINTFVIYHILLLNIIY